MAMRVTHFIRLAVLFALAMLPVAEQAKSQQFALAAKQVLSLGTNVILIDSFDSMDTNYSTFGLYDPAKRKANGDIASTDGVINVQDANIMGTLYTGPAGGYTIGPQGSVGDLGWVLGGTTGLQPGHYRSDLNLELPDVLPPYQTGLPPDGDVIDGTNYTWILGYGNYIHTNSGGVNIQTGDQILVVGRVRVYVTGDFIMREGASILITPGASMELYVGGPNTVITAVNNAGNCGTFSYWGLLGNTNVSLTVSDTFLGTIYAPRAALSLSGGTNVVSFQGACTAMSIQISGQFDFHFDENLKRKGTWVPPLILIQPRTQAVAVGEPVTFTVSSPVGLWPTSYQWRFAGTDIPGATNSSFTIPSAGWNDAGIYSVILTNAFGSVASSNAILYSVPQPPTNLRVTGVSAGIVMLAWDPGPATNSIANYKIYYGAASGTYTNSVSAGTNLAVTVSNPVQGRTYYCAATATDTYGLESDYSSEVTITIPVPLTNQPPTLNALANITIDEDASLQTVNLSGITSGATNESQTLTITASSNNTNLIPTPAVSYTSPNATGSITFTPVANANGWVTITVRVNDGGASDNVVSRTFTVTVNPSLPPAIIQQPASHTVLVGSSAAFSVSAAGSPPLSYQWRFNGADILTATTASLTLTNVQLTQAGSYAVLVTNAYGTVESSNAVLTVNPPPPCVTPPSGLVSWWPGDGTANDTVGSNNGTPLNNASFAPGKVNAAFSFDGNYECAQIPYSQTLIASNYSTEAWVKPLAQVSGQSWIFGQNFGHQLLLRPGSSGIRIRYEFGTSHSTFYFVESTSEIPIGQFSHLVGTWDGTTLRLYMNGVLNSQATPGASPVDSGCPFYIGGLYSPAADSCQYVDQFFNGLIDEVSYFNRALSATEIQSLYNADSAGKCSPPPVIVTSPLSQTVVVANTATFSVTAGGTPPLAYQWRFNGLEIGGATNSTYSIASAVTGDAGNYDVVVTNSVGSVTSAVAVLMVNKAIAALTLGGLSQIYDGTAKAVTVTTTPASLTVNLTYDGSPAAPTTAGSYMVVGIVADVNYQGSATNTLVISKAAASVTLGNLSQTYDGTAKNATVTTTPPGLSVLLTYDGSTAAPTNIGSYTVVATVTEVDYQGGATNTLVIEGQTISRVFVALTNGMSGGTIVVPIMLSALGSENALGFSLTYNPNMLVFQSAQLGAAVASGSMFINPSFTNLGRLGIAVSQPFGVSFPAGTQEVVRINFLAQLVTNTVSTTIAFTDVPTGRQLVDAVANILPASYVVGTATLTPVEYEADVSPRPDGDHALTIADWVQVGRFVAALDAVTNGNEFLRADCAPRANLGNGHLTVTDWVQAGRYAVGLDPVTVVGGPTPAKPLANRPLGANDLAAKDGDPIRTLEVGSLSGQAGQYINVPVLLHSLGDENALGFSISFDPAILAFRNATAGTGAVGANVNLNSTSASDGKVGVVLALSPGGLFAAGTQQVAVLQFAIKPEATNPAVIAFNDTPVMRELSDAAANVLSTSYVDGQVTMNPLPLLRIEQHGADVVISWSASSSAFLLQSAGTLSPMSWDSVALDIVTNGPMATVTVPATNALRYFRLQGM